jgi:hypothetical protein
MLVKEAIDRYQRTNGLFKVLSAKFELEVFNGRDVAETFIYAEQKLPADILACLKDVYQFESERSVFVEDFNWQNFKDHSLLVSDIISLGKDCLAQMTVQISSQVILLESEWPWCQRSGQTALGNHMEHIFQQNPSYFLTAIIPLRSSNTFYEYQFDVSGIMLIDLLSDSMTVTRAYELMLEQLPRKEQDFEQRFYYYVRFFLYLGILGFKG